MLKSLSLTTALVCGMLALPATADEVDDAILAFINGDGFKSENADAVDERMLPLYTESPGAMRPDSGVSVLEKALLVTEAMEPALPRTRYMLRYGQMIQNETPVSFVTIERYNLGPAIRKMVAEDYGEENVDGPEAFGVGPHVAWRLVAIPVMGQEAGLIEVARREIPDAEAAAEDCGGRKCLSLDTLIDDLHAWNDLSPGIDLAKRLAIRNERGATSPSLALAELLMAAGLTGEVSGEVVWSGPEHPEAARGSEPFIFVGIDHDLGQEANVDAILGQTLLNDDSVAELWYRRNAFIDMEDIPAYWQAASVGRKR
jgi:hypothetical protein